MSRLTRPLLVVLPLLGFATPVYESRAQPVECGSDDQQCLEDSFAVGCGRSALDDGTCLAWVQRVEAHPLGRSLGWKLIAATGYARVADFAESKEVAERHEERSRSILREVLAASPDGHYAAQAYTGLAALTDDVSESISLLRDAMRADPSNTIIPYLLARTLEIRGEDADYSEAADFYRVAYRGRNGGYYFAASALRLYSLTGQNDRGIELRAEVARDSGMDNFAEEVASARFGQDLERAEEVFATACRSYVAAIFGPETCAAGIEALVAAIRAVPSGARRRSIVDVATEGMRMLAVSGSGTFEEQRRRESRFGSILRAWIDAGDATAATYVLWAQHIESNLDESVAAFERAVELAPDNGRYRYWLAAGYIEQGRYDEAIEHLTLARDTLPENLGFTPESVDTQIRRAESMRSRGR